MVSVTARGIAVAATIAAVAVTAGCKDKDQGQESGDGVTAQPSSSESAPGMPTETATTPNGGGSPVGHVSLFPGSDSGDSGDASGSAIDLPGAQVGEPTGGTVSIENNTDEPKPLQDIAAGGDTDGTTVITEDGCSGTTLQPGETCEVGVQHTASQPGPYSAQVTVTTAAGTITVPVSGEATGPTTTTPDTTTATETGTPTDTLTTPGPTDSDTTVGPTPEPDEPGESDNTDLGTP
ncbi:hypothetical protein [Streptomyces olivochromogenes]|uniref:hypothetical protein n=1 Tax=Streptomyces olivochromogenes TaxID=1963 RepID=UPI001F447282|nr:hypothetical protein [Streptomyces olivochromogenes]MCF3135832.1 hypothetical protein [Streptomyces olivochromogenes]